MEEPCVFYDAGTAASNIIHTDFETRAPKVQKSKSRNPCLKPLLLPDLSSSHPQCSLVVRVLAYRYRGPGFDSRALQKKVVVLERGPLSLVSTIEELLDRKVAAPV
jgi:hypothetical protein